jgi:hypothetical protein
MKKLLSQIFKQPWYPLAFSLYPALALLSVNVGQVNPDAGLRPIIFSILLAGALFFILWLIFRQPHRSAFLTLLWLVLFFSYGHAYNLLDDKYPDANFTPWLAAGWLVLLLVALWWATRHKLNFAASAGALNTIALGLVVIAGGQILFGAGPKSAHALGADNAPIQQLTPPDHPPDVYYFILDSYGRADLLDMVYGYDNGEFVHSLEERGFYVAGCSMSNYVRTEISLASSLNMMYLQELDSEFKPESTARSTLWDSLKHSAARYNLESMGYQTIAFETGYAWNELRDADLFLSPPPFSSGMTEFEGLFLRTTLARHLQDWGWVDPDAVMGQSYRDRFLFIFDSMDEIAQMPGPQFVYVHVISPHPPFVFDGEGNPTYPADFWNEKRMYPYDLYSKGLQNQTTFLNKKMLEAIDTLLSKSDTPPIIIIQGDHGPWMLPKDQRMWILNAYYLPGHAEVLYPTISPVNTFRLVFNAYFGGNYDMLDDVSYFSPVPNLYDFTRVPNRCEEP